MSPLATSLKSIRNAAASTMAVALQHAPALERAFGSLAFTCRNVPGLHGLFREATDRLGDRLTRDGRQIREVRVGDCTIQFDVTEFTVKGSYFSRVPYESGATGVLLSTLQRGGVFVDIGAHSGYFTLLAAMRVGSSGHVFAFEPSPAVRSRLQHHVTLNAVADRVSISDLALGARNEDGVDFFLSCSPHNSGLSSLVPPAGACEDLRSDVKIPVSVRTFDAWVTAAGLMRADLIKIDVEGSEQDVLAGMTASLERLRFPPIICETRWDGRSRALLGTIGYSASVIDEIPGGIPNLLFVHRTA